MSSSQKVVLITGAGRGSGAKIARAMAKKGYIVAANDITPINVDVVANKITTNGGTVSVHLHDIAKKLDTQALINDVIDAYGKIDLLINTANVDLSTELFNVDEWDLHRVFEVNVIGAILLTQSMGRVMRSQGFGTIINVLPSTNTVSATQLASIAALEAVCAAAKGEFAANKVELRSLQQPEIEAWLAELPILD